MWEETIILLPDNVHYVFLSATIPNARQFAEWIAHLHKQVQLTFMYFLARNTFLLNRFLVLHCRPLGFIVTDSMT